MKKAISVVRNSLELLRKDIYVGERKKNNLKGLSITSLFCCFISVLLFFTNAYQGLYQAAAMSFVICILCLITFVTVFVFENRMIPKVILLVGSAILFTIALFKGVTGGVAILWAMVIPTCYMQFLDTRLGIMLECYIEIIICMAFYCPSFKDVADMYTPMFVERFPVIYFAFVVLSTIQMCIYHIGCIRSDMHEAELGEAVTKERERVQEAEKKRTEAELEKKKAEYENATKNQFLERMSHVIRTPINGIVGMNELILKEGTDWQTVEYARNVKASCCELMEIVDSLLKASDYNIDNDGYLKEDEFESYLVKTEKKLEEVEPEEVESTENTYIEADLSGISVLEVDDNEINRKLICSFLKRTKCEYDIAKDGFEALEKTGAKHYDIVLMDHIMPGINGIEVVRRMRADSSNASTDSYIIALTANAVEGAAQRYKKEGFDDYIAKPVDYNQFILKLVEQKKRLLGEDEASIIIVEDTKDDLYVQRDHGLSRCMEDEEFYDEIIQDFLNQGQDNIIKLKTALEDRDYKTYHMIVHALKNTTYTIGADNFSKLSKRHEIAIKEDRLAYIEDNGMSYIETYKKLIYKAGQLVHSKG